MKHTTRNRRRWLTRVALGLAVVAVAAPSAQAMIPASTSPVESSQVTDGLGRPLDPAAVRADEQMPIVVVDDSKFRIDAQLANEPVRPDDRPVRPTAEVVRPGDVVDLPGGIVVAPADGIAQLPTIDALNDFSFDGTQTPDPVSRVAGPVPGNTTLVPDQTPTAVRPDDRPVRPTIVGNAPVELTPVVRVGGPAPGNTALVVDEPQGHPASGPGFDWNDAGVGIGIGIAACLALLTAWLLLGGRKPDHFAGA